MHGSVARDRRRTRGIGRHHHVAGHVADAGGSTVPSGSVFFVPGIGNVTLTYCATVMTTTRLTGGSADERHYTWTNYEAFTTYFTAG